MPIYRKLTDLREQDVTITTRYRVKTYTTIKSVSFVGKAYCMLYGKIHVNDGITGEMIHGPYLLVKDQSSGTVTGSRTTITKNSLTSIYSPYKGENIWKRTLGNAISSALTQSDVSNFYDGATNIYLVKLGANDSESVDLMEINIDNNEFPVFHTQDTIAVLNGGKSIELAIPDGETGIVSGYDRNMGFLMRGSANFPTIISAIINKSFVDPVQITHNIYLSSYGQKKSGFYIQTEVNMGDTNGYVETQICRMIGKSSNGANGYFRRNDYLPDYEHESTTASDRPSMKSYAYEDFYSQGANDSGANMLTKLALQDIYLAFRDTIYYDNGTTEVCYSPLGTIPANNSMGYLFTPKVAYPTTQTVSDKVNVNFIDGEPSEDDLSNNSDGEVGDTRNYDGSSKYKIPSGTDKDGLSYGDGVAMFGDILDCWYISRNKLKSLRAKLWSQSFFDILKINSNPLDNIVSLKAFPFPNTVTTTGNIHIGNIDTGIVANPIGDCIRTDRFPSTGDYRVGGKFGNFLDLKANLGLYLPFIGFHKLDTELFMYQNLHVVYKTDILSGACECYIFCNNNLVDTVSGQMGCDLPLSASTQKQAELAMFTKNVNLAKDTIQNVANKNVGGMVDTGLNFINNNPQIQYHSTSVGSVLGASGVMDIYLLYDFPMTLLENSIVYPNGFLSSHGAPNMTTCKIDSLSGFIKTSGDVKLTGLDCTEPEKEEIVSLLSKGVEK